MRRGTTALKKMLLCWMSFGRLRPPFYIYLPSDQSLGIPGGRLGGTVTHCTGTFADSVTVPMGYDSQLSCIKINSTL